MCDGQQCCKCGSMRNNWEKVLEYASSPIHGTMSRKLRKGVKLQVNNNVIYSEASIFINDNFLRFVVKGDHNEMVNTYYDLRKISSLATISEEKESGD